MCRAHATVRGIIREIVSGAEDVTIADMEAGLEPLSRGTPRHTDIVIAVMEPYYRSLETAARVIGLAKELGVARVCGVANKVRDEGDRNAVKQFCEARGIELLSVVPYDEAIIEADRLGRALIDHAPEAAAVLSIKDLARALTA